MKKYLCLILCLFLLNGCSVKNSPTEESKETGSTESDLMKNEQSIPPVSDFYELGSLPKAKKEQSLDNIVKIYFAERNNLENKNKIAIDLGNKGLYLEPEFEIIGHDSLDYELSNEEIEEIKEILSRNKVDTWEVEYTEEYDKEVGEAAYNWLLRVQYTNGEIYNKQGKGNDKQKIEPENYQAFVNELTSFVEERK
ncbi:hypothetical protein [Enterococcus sp. BWR-S5]|uniref:hypothetical protein n=1 Tax=Enterococcus sp. BWR-S5 TaxID=2787714 RepID=UPI001925000D|nr:hypothetical protein [Enterococcus sp. BWR-S5]MBL1226646.1 hypothetical protein [Enterococcus sp. BWR-S5]